MKGILLAGGRGRRLYPLTLGVCKQLLPIFDKPMVYYPLSVLMHAGIQEILIISTPEELIRFKNLFRDGAHLGLSIEYLEQPFPQGIAQSLIIGAEFIGKESIALILGDNIFYGHSLPHLFQPYLKLQEGAVIFGYQVQDPERYGVLVFDESHRVKDIIEKPSPSSPSRYAVTGLYFYDNEAPAIAKRLKPSARGEYEITDINKIYLQRQQLQVHLLDRGFAWLDTGTHDSLQKASLYVQALQERQGIKIACLEEIAYQQSFISLEQLKRLSEEALPSEYGQYLQQLYS